jgi:putative transcriptional regulator
MLRCALSILMGQRRVRIADVARATGISRNQLTRMYNDQALRVELRDIEKLCTTSGVVWTSCSNLCLIRSRRSLPRRWVVSFPLLDTAIGDPEVRGRAVLSPSPGCGCSNCLIRLNSFRPGVQD